MNDKDRLDLALELWDKDQEKIKDIKEIYIDEHKRWALNCGDSSCCVCTDLLAVLDAINDVLEIHGKPVCYQGLPIEWGCH